MLKADPDMKSSFWDGWEEIPEDLEWVWRAFIALSPSRHRGFGEASIPFEVIDRYADRYAVEDFEEFHILIRAMDAAYLDARAEKKEPNG